PGYSGRVEGVHGRPACISTARCRRSARGCLAEILRIDSTVLPAGGWDTHQTFGRPARAEPCALRRLRYKRSTDPCIGGAPGYSRKTLRRTTNTRQNSTVLG